MMWYVTLCHVSAYFTRIMKRIEKRCLKYEKLYHLLFVASFLIYNSRVFNGKKCVYYIGRIDEMTREIMLELKGALDAG